MVRVTAADADHARVAYDAFAPFYDEFTAHHDYADWCATIERLARAAGLRGTRLLDVACGTGKSFLPFLERGWSVTACDVSARMLERAAAKAAGRATLAVHDMRRLPVLGAFDLVLCLDDAMNYLLGEDELRGSVAGLAANLAAGGVLAFDANTLRAYRSFFATTTVVRSPRRFLAWEGRADPAFGPGEIAEAELTAFEHAGAGWTRTGSAHRQRHHPEELIRAALAAAGLDAVQVYGMQLDGSVRPGLDELRNTKALYIARPDAPEGEGR
jgi:SAM-dependent methyltransferase